MTRPVDIPPPGAPLVGLSPLLSEIAAAANRDDMPAGGLFGSEGTATAPPPQVSIGLFKLSSVFQSGTPSPTWTDAPGDAWHWATATRVEYYAGSPNTWNTPADQGDEATTPDTETIWAPNAMLQTAAGANGEYVWCFYDEGPGCWVLLAQAPPRWDYTGSGYGTAIPAANFLTEVASPSATLPRAGTYLIAYHVSIAPAFTAAPQPQCQWFTNLYVNHAVANSANLQNGHFHCGLTMQATIPIGAIDGTNPTAPVTLDVTPAFTGAGYGQLSWITTLRGNQGDVITVAAGSLNVPATIINCTLTVVLLRP